MAPITRRSFAGDVDTSSCYISAYRVHACNIHVVTNNISHAHSTLYETVERLSVRLSVCPVIATAAEECGGLLLIAVWGGNIDRQQRAPGAQQQMRAVSR